MCTGMEVALLAAGGLQAGGSIYNGIAGAQSAKVDQRIAGLNRDTQTKTAETERLFADLELRRAAADEASKRTEVAGIIGQQRAYFGASNLDPAMGSPLLLQATTAAQGEVDAGLIRAQGELDYASGMSKAASTQAGAATSAYQSEAAGMRAQQDLIAGALGAGTAILGAATKWPGLTGGAGTYQPAGAPLDIRPSVFRLS
jgi:hypothetical protein